MHTVSRTVLAASALKLGGLAALDAEASIVYTPVGQTAFATVPFGPNPPVLLDITGDGTTDLGIFNLIQRGGDAFPNTASLVVSQASPDQVLLAADGTNSKFPLIFAAGDPIDAGALANPDTGAFVAGDIYGKVSPTTRDGFDVFSFPGAAGGSGFLGFETLDTSVDPAIPLNYGWLQLSVAPYDPLVGQYQQVRVCGYAVEDSGSAILAGATDAGPVGDCPLPDAEQPWVVPEPDSLALFALGAVGFGASGLARRRRTCTAAA